MSFFIKKLLNAKCTFCIATLVLGGVILAPHSLFANNPNANSTVTSQKEVVKGKVLDSAGQPLIGALVLEQGTTNGAVATVGGVFEFEVNKGATLVASFIGYKEGAVAYNGQNIIFKLEQDGILAEEVVVVGYGTQKKSNLTGSVATISGNALETRVGSSVSSMLAGQVPGVTSIQTSGAPGSQSSSLTIRGKNSVNAGSPLVIVDGVPGSMNSVDPSDIASFTVLKDAASSAIYGVQAANGVILITTKRGKKGATRVSYSGSLAVVTPTATLNHLGSADHAMLYNEAILNENPNGTPMFSDQQIEEFRNGTGINTNWYDEAVESFALEAYNNVSISGGTESTTYSASFGHTLQNGLDNSEYQRFNLRSNIESKINSWLTTGVNLSTYRSVKEESWNSYAGIVHEVNRVEPWAPAYLEDGSLSYNSEGNPVAYGDPRNGTRNYMSQQLSAVLYAQIDITSDLNIKGVFSAKNDHSNNSSFKKDFIYGAPDNLSPSTKREGYEDYKTWNAYTSQVLINYDKTIGKHSFSALAGFEQTDNYYKFTKASRIGGGSNELEDSLNTLDPSTQKNEDGGNSQSRRSFFGRVKYDYMSKYLIEANMRSDASSRFPADNRWGVFPSLSGAWRVSEESFYKNSSINNWMSYLKVRAGWGQTGNEELRSDDIYPSIPTYGYTPVAFNEGVYSSVYESKYINPLLTWATVVNTEVAIEAQFFQNKLGFELAAYNKTTKDMMLYLPIQGVIGVESPAQNIGSVQNRGFDLNVYHNNQINGDFQYRVGFNLAYVKNEVVDMAGTEGPTTNDKYWNIEGSPIGSFYGYQSDGFFNTQDDLDNHPKRTGKETLGDIKYTDLNGDGKITAADRTVLGQDFPSWTAGLNLSMSYKNFDLSALFQGAWDVAGYYNGESAWAFYVGARALDRHLDRWTPDNHDATYPRITKSTEINYSMSDFWMQNSSYLRLKNLSLGYSVPKKALDKIGLQRIYVYVAGENLWTLTGLEGIDPEAPGDNRGAFYSNVIKGSLGLKITF